MLEFYHCLMLVDINLKQKIKFIELYDIYINFDTFYYNLQTTIVKKILILKKSKVNLKVFDQLIFLI